MKSSPTNACSCIDQRAKGWKKKKKRFWYFIKNYWEKPNKREIPNEAHNFKGDSKLASDVQSWSLRKVKWKGNLMSFNCCKTFNKYFPRRILHVTRWQILPHSLPHHPQQKNILTQRLLITSSQIWPFHPRYNQWGTPPNNIITFSRRKMMKRKNSAVWFNNKFIEL